MRAPRCAVRSGRVRDDFANLVQVELERPMFRYDPFSSEAMADPHRFYPELRADHPAYRLAEYHGWAIPRFADCWQVLQDHDRFSVVEGPVFTQELVRKPFEAESLNRASPQLSFGIWDPPHHTRIRRTMTSFFSPKRIESLEGDMRRLARDLLEDLVPRGTFDVVGDLAGPYALGNICRVLNLELDALPELFKLIQRSTARTPGVPGFTAVGMEAQAQIHPRICEAVLSRPACDTLEGGDIASALAGFEFDGVPLCEADVATQLFTLMLGGAETVPKVIAGGLLELAHQPEQWRALVRDPGLVPVAFEEMMRHQGPLQHVGRTLLDDVEIAGEAMKRGDRVFLLLQSANRDDREFRDGENFDIHREPRRNLAFGIGRHHCIGSHLARLEGRVLLETFLEFVGEYGVREREVLRPGSEFQVGVTRLPVEISPTLPR